MESGVSNSRRFGSEGEYRPRSRCRLRLQKLGPRDPSHRKGLGEETFGLKRSTLENDGMPSNHPRMQRPKKNCGLPQ